jgi:transketolase
MATETLQDKTDMATNPSQHPGLSELDQLCVQTIRFLAMDAVQKAKSGHPGICMGMAPATYKLWTKYLKHSPTHSKWHNRDRFVLSAGHGSMLLYSMLHLCGYDLPLDELKQFRQWDSKTPGHPEFGLTDGVEVTTGPLGQGISNAVGMAVAEKYLASHFNRDGFDIIDYNIYVIAGDGCLMEGVSSEACSLAGHLGLDNLIVIYDNNQISIDGSTDLSFTEDRAKRYESYGWNVIVVEGDGNDMETFEKAMQAAQAETDRPTMIQLKTHIGYGSPNFQDTHTAHGAPLGDDEIRTIKENAGWDPEKSFHVPEEVSTQMGQCVDRGNEAYDQWTQLFAEYEKAHPELAQQFRDAAAKKLSVNLDELLPTFETGQTVATRSASGKVLDALMPHMPLVLGGSADLTPSNNTQFKGAEDFQKNNPNGRYIRYGVREHAMGSIMNGIVVSDLLRAYGGTFFCFADYMRASIRLAALSHYPTTFVFTHDSIGLGEDGPTHQPVEHAASLRAMPGLNVIRPADANETAQAWKFILENPNKPVALLLTRQGLAVQDATTTQSTNRGAYILKSSDNPQVILMSTGSEVEIAMDAHDLLAKEGIASQVVSMPCWELFEQQDQAYRDTVIPPAIKARVAIEAGIRQGWDKWIGDNGQFIGMTGFGASAPYKTIYQQLGLTAQNVAQAAKKNLKNAG